MKTFVRLFTVLIVFGLVFTAPMLNAAEKKDAKKELCCAGCGEVIKGEAKFKTEYKGKTYYFSHEKCLKEFKADPEKALKACEGTCCSKGKKDVDKKDKKIVKVAYVCPMKVCKVKQDKPGKCPKCGMDLKKVVLKEGHGHDHDQKGHDHKHGDKDHKH